MRKLIIMIFLAFSLYSCDGGVLPVVSTVKAVVVADSDRRSLGSIADDNVLDLNLEAWALNNEELNNSHVNFTVYNGIVLITGEVSGPEVKKYLLNETPLQSDNINKIIDETVVGETTGIARRTKDTYIDNRIALALHSQDVVNPVHVKIHTENLVVFLMGEVTEREASAAVKIVASAGSANGVTNIIKHFNYLADIPPREKAKAKERAEVERKQRENNKKRQELDAQKKILEEQIRELEREGHSL